MTDYLKRLSAWLKQFPVPFRGGGKGEEQP